MAAKRPNVTPMKARRQIAGPLKRKPVQRDPKLNDLRDALKQSRPSLDVAGLDDDQVLTVARSLPPAPKQTTEPPPANGDGPGA